MDLGFQKRGGGGPTSRAGDEWAEGGGGGQRGRSKGGLRKVAARKGAEELDQKGGHREPGHELEPESDWPIIGPRRSPDK